MRRRLVVIFLFISLVSFLAPNLFAQQQDDWYQEKPIRDITFDGLRHVDVSELRAITDTFIGRLFNDTVFLELQSAIYALEYFDLISPSAVPADPRGSEVIIRFNVTERPIISKISFVGNSGLRTQELFDVISVKVNDVSNQLKVRVDELAIQNKYQEKGFPDASVRSEFNENTDGTITLIFYLNEGEKISIESIRFEGNTIFPERTLKNQLSLKERGFFTVFQDGAFQEVKLVADRNAITQYYHDRGYIDAAVTDVTQNIQKNDAGENMMTLTFRIYEGRTYTFGGITFEGNHIFSSEQLSSNVTSKTGEVVNAQQVEADLQRVADVYYENGYLFNTIAREEIKNSDNGTISYIITIVERNRAYIENITIIGNEKTKDEVILREFDLEPGDVFSKTKVMDGLRNLYNLQFFSIVTPDTPEGSTDNLMNLIINVEEQPTTELNAGMSFSGVSDPDTIPISLIIGYNDRNFLGTGNSLGANLNLATNDQTVSVNYTHRWIFGLPLSGGFDLTAGRKLHKGYMDNFGPFFNGNEDYAFPDGFETYEEYENSGKVPVDQYLMDYTQWDISLGFSSGYRWIFRPGILALGGGVRVGVVRNEYEADLYRPFDPTLRDRNNQWTPENSFWFNLSLDNRDVYFDPTNGYYISQRLGFYGIIPQEREHYIRTDTKAEYFLTLFDLPITENYALKGIFAIHTGVSFLFPAFGYPLDIESPNRLYVDGMFNARGWTNDRLNRGLALWENWAEIRVPLVPGLIALDTFFDMAAVAPSPEEFFTSFSADQLRFSFGIGARFTIPQFPFRIMLAKRFKVVDGLVEWQTGNINPGNTPGCGVDFVISFTMAQY
ncbi:MAG: outer membrane protein assembly factor BamA [Treponema sp.]|nr:outer membrane protein assembly factor BamA [Treponema sp.]